jgi:hypothetical protein
LAVEGVGVGKVTVTGLKKLKSGKLDPDAAVAGCDHKFA